MDINVDKLKPFTALIVMQVISCLIAGFLLLYLFLKGLFFSLDLFRLSMIALSMTTPILMLNTIIFQFKISPKRSDISPDLFHEFLTTSVFMGSFASLFVIYFSILIGYFFSLNFKSVLVSIICLQLLIVLLSSFIKEPVKPITRE